ncbi:MAG: lipid IV(A) 3-deoxy-D-manno-octulosonic acid transferase [Burkholderiales bacterium]|nr:lipid IV(A) 3-deoxy-D-manno-octulosonic acid transferase [Burkholderiales bacterium]
MRYLYTLALYALLPFILLRLVLRSWREPGYLRQLGERFGIYRKTPGSPLIWVHAVSVGETRAAQPLIEALLKAYPEHYILLTHMTPTGRETGRELFGGRVERCFLPYDLPGAVRQFLNHFSPRAGILMETEIWPNLIHACRKAGVPLYLVNARLSRKSWAGYRRLSGLTRRSFAALAAVAAQSEEDARRLAGVGAVNVLVTGNLKFDAAAAAGQLDLARTFRARFGRERPVLLAASTREGEEELLLDRLGEIAVPGLLLVVVPRHPRRFDSVALQIRQRGFTLQRRTDEAPIEPDTRVVLGDSMGEMTAYYGACDVAFVGGSLMPFGAHNLIEACAVGKPVLIGPSVYNFKEAVESAVRAGAAIRVRDARALAVEATRLLTDRELAARMGAAAAAFCDTHRGATAKVMALIRLRENGNSPAAS